MKQLQLSPETEGNIEGENYSFIRMLNESKRVNCTVESPLNDSYSSRPNHFYRHYEGRDNPLNE